MLQGDSADLQVCSCILPLYRAPSTLLTTQRTPGLQLCRRLLMPL